MKNIFKRNNKYYFRTNIPKILESQFEQTNLYIKCLYTSDKAEAIKLRNILYNKLKVIKDSVEMRLDKKTIEALVNEFKTVDIKNIFNEINYLTNEEINKKIIEHNNIIKYDDYSELNDISTEILETINIEYDSEDNCDNIINISKILNRYILDKLIEVRNNTNSAINSKYISNKPLIEETDKKTYINDTLIDKYFKENEHYNSTYINNVSRTLELLKKYFKEKDIKEIKRSDIVEFRNSIIMKLKNQNNKKVLISKKTVNQHIVFMGAFFKYLEENDYIEKNICTNVKVKIQESDEIERVPYTDDDIEKVKEYIGTVGSKYKNRVLEIVTIGQYTGMRLGEILQLKKSDIVIEDSILCFKVDGKVKNKYSRRIVPIHSKLIELVKSKIAKLKDNELLYEIKLNYFTKVYSQWNGAVGFGREKVFHSYRHTFSNKLKQQLVEPTVIDELTGHAHSSSGMSIGRYSNTYNINILKEAIEKVSYQE